MIVPARRSERGGQPHMIMNWCLTWSLGAVMEPGFPRVGFRHPRRLIRAPECLFWNAAGGPTAYPKFQSGGTARLAQARAAVPAFPAAAGPVPAVCGGELEWVQLVFAERGEVRSYLLEAPREGRLTWPRGMGHATGDVTGLAA